MTSLRNKRLGALEGTIRNARERRPYIWVQPGETPAEALAATGRPDDGHNEFFMWRAAQ